MRSERFFNNSLLPFVELRYSTGSAASFKPHMHRTLSVGALELGEAIYTINGNEVLLVPGSLALINPEALHTCNPIDPIGRSYYMLFFDTEWCLQVQQSMWEVDAFVAMSKFKIDDEPLYRLYCTTVGHLMNEAIHLQEKEQMMFDLAVEIFTLACEMQKPKKENKASIEKLKYLLSVDLQKDLPLNLLANRIDANPYTLIRVFKAETGLTPHAYRMNCRIEQAKKLLRQGRDITETALECGFFDQSHLHRYFKAMTTVTPKEYLVNFVQ